MNDILSTNTPIRQRAAALALVALLLLGAGVLPVCSGVCCPMATDDASVHAQMPCCASQSSFAPMSDERVPPATAFAGQLSLPQIGAPVTVADSPRPRVLATLPTASSAHHEPSPPLFLLNAQFLI